MERLHDACGIVGIYTQQQDESIDVRRYLTLALTALQHRGQESAGMAVYDGEGKIVHRVGMGKVREVFSDTGTGLPDACIGIGHVRYSTTGSSCVENAGPFVVDASAMAAGAGEADLVGFSAAGCGIDDTRHARKAYGQSVDIV